MQCNVETNHDIFRAFSLEEELNVNAWPRTSMALAQVPLKAFFINVICLMNSRKIGFFSRAIMYMTSIVVCDHTSCYLNLWADARLFDMEYRKWEDDCRRLSLEMRIAMEKSPEEELRVLVDKYIIRYEEMTKLKSMAIKSDIFHIISGVWRPPVERCILWMGGFRPSNLIKVLLLYI